MMWVEKRDGTTEPFVKGKLERTLRCLDGVTDEKLAKIRTAIEQLYNTCETVTTQQLCAKIIEQLTA